MIRDNLGPGGTLDNDRFSRALLAGPGHQLVAGPGGLRMPGQGLNPRPYRQVPAKAGMAPDPRRAREGTQEEVPAQVPKGSLMILNGP